MTSPTPFLPQSAADYYCSRPCRKHQPECDTQQLALIREAADSQTTHMREGAAAGKEPHGMDTCGERRLSKTIPSHTSARTAWTFPGYRNVRTS